MKLNSAVALSLLACATLTASSCTNNAPDTEERAPTVYREPPALVVQITIDQLRADYLDRFGADFTGGLAWLMKNGAVFTNAFQDHGATETAPGHATLWSGRVPRNTGIIRNSFGVGDPETPLLSGIGDGASPFRFRGSAFFDWIRINDPWARALSVSRKDRGAILPVGRAKQEVYWYGQDGSFTTSRYYADTLPKWVKEFNARRFLDRYKGKEWSLLLDESHYPEPDSIDLENRGKDFLFPHIMPTGDSSAGRNLVEFPWMDEVTVEIALYGLERLGIGKGPGTDLLSISLSATDAVGHRYGPDSRELHDQLLRVDRTLGVLIDSLFKLRDPGSIVFALSADHGTAPYPTITFNDTILGRVENKDAMDSVVAGLRALDVNRSALTFGSGMVFMERRYLNQRGINADSVIEDLRQRFLALPGVMRVDRADALPKLAASGDKIARRWHNSIPPDLGIELAVTLEPYWYWGSGRGTTHGTPHDYDAGVPIIFAGAGVKPGRYQDTIRTIDIAPTLARLTGIVPTEAVDGSVVTQIITGAPVFAPRGTRR